jgi:putative N6-adenine-specific DNA methylase
LEEKNLKIVVKTLQGLEQILLEECMHLGLTDCVAITRGVAGFGNLETVYKINHLSRLAIRVLVELSSFVCNNQQELYDGVADIEWETIFDVDKTFSIDSIANQTEFKSSLFVSQKTKDAIVDRFRRKFNKRPDVTTFDPQVKINIHIYRDNCTVLLDSSGLPLFKRGYKKEAGIAPINETLASGLVMLSNWDRKSPLVDIMCGSGSILVEAGMLVANIAPGKFRTDYCFMHWKNFDNDLLKNIKEEALSKENTESMPQIVGLDNDVKVIGRALANIESVGLKNKITLHLSNFKNFENHFPSGTIITNPPYGERIEVEEIKVLYKEIGDTLKKSFPDFDAWIFSGSLEGLKNMGLKHTQTFVLENGGLECRLRKFSMYKGTRRHPKTEEVEE